MGLEGFKQKLKLGRFKPKTTPTAAHDGAGPSGNGQVPGPNTRASEAPADQDHQSPGPSKPAFDARPISELWDIAFDKLGEEEGELIQRYKTELLCPGSVTEALGLTIGTKANRRELVDALLKRKIEEVQRDAWKLKFSTSSEVPVKDLAQPVLSMVGWANDYITEAASGNAYASIAWFGVSLLLPLLLNPSKQAVSLATGLKYVASLISQSRMWEDLYNRRYESRTGILESRQETHTEYKSALAALYRSILKYQITSYCYYARTSAFRLGLDMVKWDDWDALLDEIREEERLFTAVTTVWRDMKYDEECEALERRHRESVGHWKAVGADIQGLRKAVEDAQADSKREAILDWLSDVDPSTQYNLARQKHEPGTGEWLVNTTEFQTWQESPSSLLWLHGQAGAGKSVLSSSAIKHLRDRYASEPETALAYFYFSFADNRKQKVSEMLASLVKQLCSRRPDTPIQSLVQLKERRERPDIETLEAALAATMRGFATVHLVIDGLDECSALTGERGYLLDTLCRIVTTAPENAHILCTSRKEADISEAITPLLSSPANNVVALSRHQLHYKDIGLYIESTLASRDYSSWPDDVKAEVRDTLIEKSDGMFQYVSCHFDTLRKLKSASSVRYALQDLPTGLDNTYERMLLNLDPRFQYQVISMLKWLCFSEHSLSVRELAEVFILPSGRERFDAKYLISSQLFDAQDVLSYLGGFVVTSEDSRLVYLAHFSIKEYLTSSRASQGSAAAFSFGEPEARFHIALLCIHYHIEMGTQDRVYSDIILQECPLWGRTEMEWPYQVEMLPWKSWSAEVMDAVREKFRDTRSQRGALAWRVRYSSYRNVCGEDDKTSPWKPHLVALSRGMFQTTDMLLSTAEYLTQADLDEALQEAATCSSCYGETKRMVEILVDRGADVKGEAGPFGSALHAAASQDDNTETAAFLLGKGADINCRGVFGWSPLQLAASCGNLKMVKWLVSRGAEICNEQACAVALAADTHSLELLQLLLDCSSETTCVHSIALHQGMNPHTWYGSTEHLEALVESGCDVNAWGGEDHGYPLHAACRYHNIDAIKLLISKSADVHAIDGKYGSTLQAALIPKAIGWLDDRTRDMVELLLEKGVDVNAQGGDFGNALQAACAARGGDSTSMVRILLDHGAEVNTSGGVLGNALQAAADAGRWRIKLLLCHGADVNAQGGKHGTALHAAAVGGETDCVKFLVRHGAEVNTQGGEYETALQAAAATGQPNCVEFLLDHGAEVNTQGGRFGTALQAAAASGEPDCVKLLLDCGAEVNAVGGVYETAFQAAGVLNCSRKPEIERLLFDHGADVHVQGGHFGSAWHAAVAAKTPYSEWKSLIQRLLEAGVDVNDTRGQRPDAPTALHAMLQTPDSDPDKWEKMEFLLKCGANPHLSAGPYGFPLQAACARFTHDTLDNELGVRALLYQCPNIDVNAVGGPFATALQAAAVTGKTKSVMLLIDKGADVNIRGGRYHTALNAAVVRGYWNIVEDLLEAGAEPDCRHLQGPDEQWLKRVREEDGRGAVERYGMFWEKQMKKARA